MNARRTLPCPGRLKVEPSPAILDGPRRIEPEAQLLRACCRQRFDDGHASVVRALCSGHSMNWDRVFVAATEHGVAPLVGINLARADGTDQLVPKETSVRFRLSNLVNRDAKERAGAALAELLALCDEHSLPVMLVKGIALDRLVYDPPFPTVSSDVDLVLGASLDGVGERTRVAFHDLVVAIRRRTGWGWECEWLTHHDLTLNGLLPVCFRSVWDDAREIEYRGHRAFTMSPEDLLISACISSYRRRLLRLKLLCDVAETVARHRELDGEWMWHKANRYRCTGIVYAGLVAAGGALGLEVSPTEPPGPHLSRARRRLIRSLYGKVTRHILDRDDARAGDSVDWSLLSRYATLRLDQMGPTLSRSLKKLAALLGKAAWNPRAR